MKTTSLPLTERERRSDPGLDRTRFARDGFLKVEKFFERLDVSLLRRALETDSEFQRKVRTGSDHSGREVKLWITNRLEKNLTSAFVRDESLVAAASQLLGGEVYQWHHKVTLKEPGGGAWEWHQDYGYWYDYGCLFPDLVSCMIAIDPATRDNGCLQVLRASHRLGRLDTFRETDQTGADRSRLEAILARLDQVYCEMEPGDVLFFHANTLHRSDANLSSRPRWALLCVYNLRTNSPCALPSLRPHDPDAPPTPYERLETWPRERIQELGRRQTAHVGRREKSNP